LKQESLAYFPSMIHQLDLLQPFEFQEVTIESALDTMEADQGRLATVRSWAPLKLITICSSAWTAGILAWAIVLGDGPAVVAIALVSFASTFHSAASFWQAGALRRRSSLRAPPSDIVIRTREGAFIVVHCDIEVYRVLYSGEAKCDYVVGTTSYQLLISVGTLFLMVGIVMMSNCSWDMQVILGASYLVMNGIYMFCAMTPAVSRLWHWNLRSIKIVEKTTSQSNTFTHVLWRAIYATKQTRWIMNGNLIPETRQWSGWLDEAGKNCSNENWDWETAKNEWMRRDFEDQNEQTGQTVSKETSSVNEISMTQFDVPKRRTTLL
jgi:hypothetical protein